MLSLCVHVVPAYGCSRRPEVYISSLFQLLSTLFFESGSLWTWHSLIQLYYLLGSKPLGFTCLCLFPAAVPELQVCVAILGFLSQYWGFEHESSCLHSKHFSEKTTSPASSNSEFSWILQLLAWPANKVWKSNPWRRWRHTQPPPLSVKLLLKIAFSSTLVFSLEHILGFWFVFGGYCFILLLSLFSPACLTQLSCFQDW